MGFLPTGHVAPLLPDSASADSSHTLDETNERTLLGIER